MWVQFLGWEDCLEKEMATHSRILAWEIPRTGEPGRLQSIGLQRVGHNGSNLACMLVLVRLLIQLHVDSFHQNKDYFSASLAAVCSPRTNFWPSQWWECRCDGENAGAVMSKPGSRGQWQKDQRGLVPDDMLRYTQLRLLWKRGKFLSCVNAFN